MKLYRFWWFSLLIFLPLSTAQAIRMDCQYNEDSELDVDVTVTIPAFLAFQVGSANAVPEVRFDLQAPTLQGSTANGYGYQNVAASSITGSDISNGINARLRANCGQVQLSYSVSDSAGLGNGVGQYIPYNAIVSSSSDAHFQPPVLNNQASGESLVTTTAYGSVTDRSAIWNYRFTSTDLPSAGLYEGIVTYQASCL